MIEVGKIYYLADQFGCNFIKVIQVGKIWNEDLWAYYFKSPYLNNVIEARYSQHNTKQSQFENKEYLCDKNQIKIYHLQKMIDRQSYGSEFRGCIEVPSNVIDICKSMNYRIISYEEVKKMNLDFPFIETDDLTEKLICKKISKEDYRNMILNNILS
jgi:hypothetical protein